MEISHPLQLDGYQVRHSVKLRFITNAAEDVSITFQNLLDTFLVGTSVVSAGDLFNWVKVRHVELWASPALGSAVTVSCSFAGTTTGIMGDGIQHTDTSMGVQPAHLLCRPSRRSLASTYQTNESAVAFNLNVPTGCVVDVALSFMGTFGVSNAAQNASVATVTGATYLRGLDGLAIAATKFVPVALAEGTDAI